MIDVYENSGRNEVGGGDLQFAQIDEVSHVLTITHINFWNKKNLASLFNDFMFKKYPDLL